MVVVLIPLGSHECAKLHGVDRVQPDVVFKCIVTFYAKCGYIYLGCCEKTVLITHYFGLQSTLLIWGINLFVRI